MSDREPEEMNLKLNNEIQVSQQIPQIKKLESSVKEERRRTGRYIAILVGISLFLLALYHAWVRRIPIVASLVVPALIMFVYVAWVLYTAARDKHKHMLLDAEAALRAEAMEASENEAQTPEPNQNPIEIAVITDKEPNIDPLEETRQKHWAEVNPAITEDKVKVEPENRLTMPIILINDKLPEDLEQTWLQIVETVTNSERFKAFPTRRRYKRKFCRRKHAVFKRSYSIA
ncbi:uncharacterized protein LOC135072270 isoform X1 [Ostrinia nubilalis]|uniref:uncharacterized protein LOC135072270 isoform X1 n=2 Tax=Ostrinia nubilalis TaxID=29057 RepID=UPI0030825EC3